MRSFSQLRNEFSDVDTFYITSESRILSPPFRRSRSRGAIAVEPIMNTVPTKVEKQRRARSKSRPRALYAADTDIVKVPPGKQHEPNILFVILLYTVKITMFLHLRKIIRFWTL